MSRSVEQITRALGAGGWSTPSLVGKGFRGVLATDVWEGWAAGHYLEVDAEGKWYADTVILEGSDSGAWLDVATGGGYGTGWPDEGTGLFRGEPALDLGGSIGACVGDDLELLAVHGFAGAQVEAVLLETDGVRRIVGVTREAQAFVVLGPAGPWTLTALDRNGRTIGDQVKLTGT